MINILEKSRNEKRVIGINTYNNVDDFWSGIVKEITNEFVVLQHFTKFGKPDGLIIEKISNIESIDFEDDYSKAMEYLIENADLIDRDSDIVFSINNPETWQHDILDTLIGRKDLIVRIRISNDNYYCGFVEYCDEDSLILALIGNQGQDEGKAIYNIGDIITIRVNDIENRKRLLLYNWRKRF